MKSFDEIFDAAYDNKKFSAAQESTIELYKNLSATSNPNKSIITNNGKNGEFDTSIEHDDLEIIRKKIAGEDLTKTEFSENFDKIWNSDSAKPYTDPGDSYVSYYDAVMESESRIKREKNDHSQNLLETFSKDSVFNMHEVSEDVDFTNVLNELSSDDIDFEDTSDLLIEDDELFSDNEFNSLVENSSIDSEMTSPIDLLESDEYYDIEKLIEEASMLDDELDSADYISESEDSDVIRNFNEEVMVDDEDDDEDDDDSKKDDMEEKNKEVIKDTYPDEMYDDDDDEDDDEDDED